VSLHSELLEQATRLLHWGPGTTRQADLRRAVSAAYYALFHLLIDDACKLILRGPALVGLRPKLARVFKHDEMRSVSMNYKIDSKNSQSSEELKTIFEADPVSASELRSVAGTFVKLQETRHEADYNPSEEFLRSDVEVLVESAREASAAWRRIRKTPPARSYMVALLVGNKLITENPKKRGRERDM